MECFLYLSALVWNSLTLLPSTTVISHDRVIFWVIFYECVWKCHFYSLSAKVSECLCILEKSYIGTSWKCNYFGTSLPQLELMSHLIPSSAHTLHLRVIQSSMELLLTWYNMIAVIKTRSFARECEEQMILKHPSLNIFSLKKGFRKDLTRIINLAANRNGLTGDRKGLLTLCQAENNLKLSIQDLWVFKKLSQR